MINNKSLIFCYQTMKSLQLIDENAAELLDADTASIRAAVENDCFGTVWRKAENNRYGYYFTTAQFVR